MRKPNRGSFRSGFEHKVALDLWEREVEFEYEPHQLRYNFPQHNTFCTHCGNKKCVSPRPYLPDFLLPNGIYLEAKGEFTSKNRKKMLAVIKDHPDKDIRMVFMRDNWLSKKKHSKYSDWCVTHGVKYCVGEKIPEEWLNES